MIFSPLSLSIIAALILVGIALYALMTLRNLLKIIVALQIASKGVIIALIAAGLASDRINLAQSLAVVFILADTSVAVIGLALAVQIHRVYGTLDLTELAALRQQSSESGD